MDWQAWWALALTIGAFGLMGAGRPPHWVMLAVLVLLSVTGVIDAQTALSGFSNTGVATVAAMFVIAAGVHHSGGVDLIVHHLLGCPRSPNRARARIAVPVAGLSGFLNNTPVVATMIPAVQRWARRIDVPASKLMIPLSYASMLGGTLTLIGTSTNLVVNGQYQQLTGEAGFSLFAITSVGLPVAVVGVAALLVFAPYLLPTRKDAQKFGAMREFTMEVTVDPQGPMLGKTVAEAGLRELRRVYLVEIERGDNIVTPVPSEERLRGGDRLVFAGNTEAAADLLRVNGLVPSTHEQEPTLSRNREERRLVEAVLSPDSEVIGQTIRDARFRDRFGAAVVAVARGGERVQGNLGSIRLKTGDVLLLEARPSFLTRQHYQSDFLISNDLQTESPRHDRAWLAWLILLAVVASAASGLMSVFNAALAGAGAMLVTGCCATHQAQRSLDGPVLLTIAASFAVGGALQSTGAARAIALQIVGAGVEHPLLLVLLVYLAVSLLTELITNNAAVLVMLPIVLNVAANAGVSAEPFVFTVMMAGSASFATPLGYQTNLMVLGPGGYRFSDFLKIGLPMNLIVGLATIVTIAIQYEL